MLPVFKLWMTSAAILMEAQAVIAMRIWGMAGAWHVSPTENTRMVTEKMRAAQKGAIDAGMAAMRGGDAVTVISKAAAPVRRATRGNVTRLQKGNPLLPAKKGR
ncbi:MAG: antifreeze protein [Rhodobacteraceae bacterium]|nr:MAG: antifreeze protein [Paracoccaceae bacterium]